MGSWKGRGNQYIQLVKVLSCKLPTNSKQLPAFSLEARSGTEPRPQRWQASFQYIENINTNKFSRSSLVWHSIIRNSGLSDLKSCLFDNCIPDPDAKRGYYGFIIVVVRLRRDFLLATYSPHFFPDFFHIWQVA